MKYILYTVLIIATVGCSNEFELNEPKKETPVIYALLDPGDDNQYFRIERTFLDPEIGARVISENPDSLYYDDITVRLSNGTDTYILEKVNGDDEGIPRDEGVFATTPNTLYKLANEDLEIEFEKDEVYNLEVEGVFDDKLVTSTTTIIEKPGVSTPFEGGKLKFEEGRITNLGWSQRTGNELFTVTLYINIIETDKNNNHEELQLKWVLAEAIEEPSLSIEGVEFLQFLEDNIEVKSTDAELEVKRFLINGEYHVTAGNADLGALNRIANANTGITASGEIPTFTNLSDGLGIFGSKYTVKVNNISLDPGVRDSLTMGRFTEQLNFQ